MYDVVLFGGTDEGHKIADFLSEQKVSYVVCVATEYGAELLDMKNVRVGRMTAEEMADFFDENSVRLVIDATHPYAEFVTENIKKACKVKYIRVVREDVQADGTYFENIKAAAKYLEKTTGNILITTGSKEIAKFSVVADRAFARVLPSEESLELCKNAGFKMKNIICMQGPFSKAFNSALIRELDIRYLVTKCTGKNGGFTEKTEAAKENGVEILPVDSEHSAIFQSLQGCKDRREVKRLLLTASGGPLFGKKREELVDIKPEDALKHPNWNMGAKVTIDSSTLVNKGLEVMEAKWLFGTDNIKVLVHRQSVVHSMVEFVDNGVIAQLGAPDMRLPIQYALTYPNRLPMKNNELDFTKYPSLTFDEPDTDTFYALKLAYDALKDGGIKPTVFNSADEAAVELFMQGKISYLGISDAIAKAMSEIKNIENPTISDIWETDKLAREIVYRLEKESLI